MPVTPGQDYDVTLYARGEIDPDSSPDASLGGSWKIRAYWYDASGAYLGAYLRIYLVSRKASVA